MSIESSEILLCSPVNTLSEVTERYLAIKGISNKKHFPKYLIVAGQIWKDVFRKTLWVTKSVWKQLKAGDPYPYIDKPKDCNRLFSVGITDKCGNIQPLFYNSQLNIIPKPTIKNCNCGECECDLCGEINSMTVTTKELFTISGITYYQKCWLKYCKNGDILEYCETPTKKYNTFAGDGGDFNDDFNNDYDIGSNPLADFTIETVISQRKICTLATKPCGCPQQTESNECIIQEHCSCLLSLFSRRLKKCCEQFVQNVNDNFRGEIKISECGTKIYYKPSRHWREVNKSQFPDFLLVNYQTTGLEPDQETQVPDYAELVMFAGIDWLSKQYNGVYSLSEKKEARYNYVQELNDIILFLNPLSLSNISMVQDTKQIW
jgi:hypothetical protein